MKLDDETASLLNRWLEYGDRTVIARELKITRQTVTKVLNGQATSSRIVKAAIRKACKNKEWREKQLAYLKA